MPSEGQYQMPAGKKLSCGCENYCRCSIPKSKKIISMGSNPAGLPGFKLEAPEYKGNAALNAQK